MYNLKNKIEPNKLNHQYCKYCNPNGGRFNYLVDLDGRNVVYIDNNWLYMGAIVGDMYYNICEPIEYCPKCGRKLRK